MNDWTTPEDIRKRVAREWTSGRLLAARVPGRAAGDAGPTVAGFPLRIPLRKPKSGDLSARFVDVQAWIEKLVADTRYRVEFREVNHRVIGRQQLPVAAWLDSAEDTLVLTGHTRAAKRFDQLVRATPVEFHVWLRAHPLKALDATADWEQILSVVAWIREHPRSGLYLRQVSLPGVHTKVIERQRRVIDSLLVSAGVHGAEVSGEGISGRPVPGGRNWFERRYGFRSKPLLVRVRALDPDLELVPGASDLTMPATELARHQPPSDTVVLITENEINYLALPPKRGTLAIWGAGNRAPEALAQVGWLKDHRIYYWGDVDTHGFAILDRLRGVLPHVESFLMDREVLTAHRDSWVREPSQMLRSLSNLTSAESDLLQDLQHDKMGPNVRLEQELINFEVVATAVANLGSA